jgi:phosphohistidine phosphatase SixA
MSVYLVRHAIALERSDWTGDDRLRPLTKRGERQADAVVELLAGNDIRRITTSPTTRCRDTVLPLAAKVGVAVDDAEELAEGADAAATIALLRSLAAIGGDAVACTHGDVIPDVVRRLARDGMQWDGDLRFAKGSTWVLSWDRDRFTDGRYIPPGA